MYKTLLKTCLKICAVISFLTINVVVAKNVTITKAPIDIRLPVGEEVRLEFPETIINLNVEPEVDSKLKVFIKPDGTVFLTAKEPFSKGRSLATTAKGEVIILDIATGRSSDKVIKLNHKVDTPTVKKPEKKDPYKLMPDFLKNQYQGVESKKVKTYSYADMAAFAMQHYIGPSRLIDNLPAQRVRLRRPKTAPIRVWGTDLRLALLNSWVLNKHYITAIKVKNISDTPYKFDPRAIRGKFLFVASLHDVLPPNGSANNETVWVFITEKPFSKSFDD